MTTIKKIRNIIAIMALIGLIGAIIAGVIVYAYGQADRAAPADTIIVLGAGTRPSGAPNGAQIRRVRHAITLYQRGLAPWFLCTGGKTDNHPASEAETCIDLALQAGIPASALLREDSSTNTMENVIEARRVMDARGLKTAIVVSDNFHLMRAEWLFKAYSMTVSLSPAQATQGRLSVVNAVSGTARELGAFVLNFYRIVSSDYRENGRLGT